MADKFQVEVLLEEFGTHDTKSILWNIPVGSPFKNELIAYKGNCLFEDKFGNTMIRFDCVVLNDGDEPPAGWGTVSEH